MTVFASACTLLGAGALLFRSWPMRGWVGLVAGATLGVIIIRDRAPIHRRFHTALGVFLLLNAVSFGVPKVWAPHPPWVGVFADVVFLGALLAAPLVMLWIVRARPTTAAGEGT
jgi:hypothetical protein